MENNKEYKLIFNPGCVRALLRAGVPIADIKADKTNPDKTVFVFKKDDAFEQAFTEINKGIANAKEKEVQ